MPRHGVSRTDITQLPALFLIMLTSHVPVLQLYTKAVKPITNVLAKIPVIPTLARPVRSFMPAGAALMTTISVHVADRLAARRIPL